jgi:hypothetical protein
MLRSVVSKTGSSGKFLRNYYTSHQDRFLGQVLTKLLHLTQRQVPRASSYEIITPHTKTGSSGKFVRNYYTSHKDRFLGKVLTNLLHLTQRQVPRASSYEITTPHTKTGTSGKFLRNYYTSYQDRSLGQVLTKLLHLTQRQVPRASSYEITTPHTNNFNFVTLFVYSKCLDYAPYKSSFLIRFTQLQICFKVSSLVFLNSHFSGVWVK